MPKTLGDFLSQLITKGGGDATNEAFKNFFSNGELVKIEIPDDIARSIDNGLISLKDAKNNHPEIKNHYVKQALDGVDSLIDQTMQKYEADDATKNEIGVERNTYKRVPLLIEKLIALEQKKATANKPDMAAINKEKEELHKQILAEKTRADQAKNDYEGQVKQFKIQQKQRGLYSGSKTIYDNLDEDTKDLTLNTLITKGLQDNNATLTLDESGNLVLTKKDGSNFFGDNNQQVNAKQFVEQLLSRQKLLVTTQQAAPAATNGSANTNTGQNQAAPQGGNANRGNTNTGSDTFKDIMAGINKDLQTSNNVPIFGTGNSN